jgi:hypothetical protein
MSTTKKKNAVITPHHERLFNLGQLATELNVSPVYIKRMKWAGFQMPGGRSTTAWALTWLANNPDFKQSDWTRPRRERSCKPATPRASSSGKRH